MKNRLFPVLIISLSLFTSSYADLYPPASGNIKILVLMSVKDYGPNIFLTMDDAEKYGFEITVTAVDTPLTGCSLFSPLPALRVDTLVSGITKVTDYDVILIGPASWRTDSDPYRDILADTHALKLIKNAADSGLVIWSICASVRVLAAADVIRGKKIVGVAEFRAEIEAAGAIFLGEDLPPYIDGNIVTCRRDQYYHEQNCRAMVIAVENIKTIGRVEGAKR